MTRIGANGPTDPSDQTKRTPMDVEQCVIIRHRHCAWRKQM